MKESKVAPAQELKSLKYFVKVKIWLKNCHRVDLNSLNLFAKNQRVRLTEGTNYKNIYSWQVLARIGLELNTRPF